MRFSSDTSCLFNADFTDSDPEDAFSFSSDQLVKQVSLASDPLTGSSRHLSCHSLSAASTPLAESVYHPEPPSPVSRQGIDSAVDEPQTSCRSFGKADVDPETPVEASPGTCATPSSTAPCLSPERTTPYSRLEMTFSPSGSRLGSHRWPVLPPIRGKTRKMVEYPNSGQRIDQAELSKPTFTGRPSDPPIITL